jgi:hypothetical protein
MWNKLKIWVGDYADRWTREQVEAEVRNYLRLGGGAILGAGAASDSWLAMLAGILPFVAAQIWYYLTKLNDPVQTPNSELPQPPAAPQA